MVGITYLSSNSREELETLINSANVAMNIPSKLEPLRQVKQYLVQEADPRLLSEFLPRLFDFLSDRFGPVRKFVTEIIGVIGLKHLEFLPEIVPVLMNVLQDDTPAVARQAIACGIDLFRCIIEKIAILGLYSSELDASLESSWAWMLKFKDQVYAIAFQPGSGGVRLLALKFVEAVILLYTPDPIGSSEPPPPSQEKNSVGFNISWLRGGHPVLNVGDLSIEASQRLGLLLDQLRFPRVKSLSNSVIIVLINSLSEIAKKRPAYYGRILPVLLGLDPPSSVIKGVHVLGARHALKNAFLSCLKSTHPAAAPWRDRLVGALREINSGGLVEQALLHVCGTNGTGDEGKDDFPTIKEQKPSIEACDTAVSNIVRKRPGAEESSDLAEENDVSVKRVRHTPSASEESSKELTMNTALSQDDVSSTGPIANRDLDTGTVQQLVAMFGALVAQGEKAVGSLEILISNISADLLAELVMANMRYLPLRHPQAEGDESLVSMSIVGSDTQAKYSPSFLADVLSLSSTFPPIASLFNAGQSMSRETMLQNPQGEKGFQVVAEADSAGACAGTSHGAEGPVAPAGLPASDLDMSGMAYVWSAPSDIHHLGTPENGIPGLESSLASTELEDASQEQVASLGGRSSLDFRPSVSTDRSEELSPKAGRTDFNSLVSSTATSVGLPYPVVLPKMSAPVISLVDEQKDHLQKLAFIRIIEAYKQTAVAGGSQIRFSLLAYLGVEFPLELDPWKLLQEHILSDYVNHEGHELTLRVLYRLFGVAEEESDFFSSTTAASVYEMFLLTVAETLRDSFPPSDKSLSKLLGEVPYLPKSVLKFLECLCSPGNSDKAEELQNGDRVTQGLSTVWSLILLRPPIRDACLKIALQSAVHHLEEVRMKAIRLVANKLYPLSSISQQIEDFAKDTLLSVINGDAAEKMDAEGSIAELQKDYDFGKPSNEHQSVSAIGKDISSETHQSGTSETLSSTSIPEAQRCMSLYFALCTKKHSLFHQIFLLYDRASKAVKQAVQLHVPILVRTMGSSLELLEIISDPPSGSENLLLQVLHTLTDGMAPSPELIFTIRKLYDSKVKDAEVLITVLPFLPRDEVLLLFPHLVNLPLDKFKGALARTLQGSSHSGPVLTPAEVLIAIHGIDPDRDGVPLKKVTDACNACFEERQIFTQQVLAKVLNQLVEQIPLPLLFMRTVLQAIGAFPALVEFIMEILSRLVSKQIWKYPKLWVGFLKCAYLTKPQSFSVLLQLPPQQLENALNRTVALKAPLVAHASQPNIRSSLPRSVLVVLGIAPDSQTSSQAQSIQAQTEDTINSDKEAVTDKSKESSSAS
ncbi:DUF3453 domain-containing protein/Symplekin_C domain-containing protein [Cephalotus follicularis]|uniref:DUF3453 domain-containing protein/Symplekin_C domain-containing protein n=1 Tax=Cephalotus follicularis TaxID=3775 RepID=A0A1Q3C5U8_CEPFO|nr:DUF3453 domain-containing protein/Symplekin_C domain-containing protein [Cephalotus follicularis]